MYSFPVSVKAPADEYENNGIALDIIGEVLDGVVDFARKLTERKQAPARQLTEAERMQLARNPQTPAAWLEALTADESSLVRNELIFNPALPLNALQRLAADQNRFIASQARTLLTQAA